MNPEDYFYTINLPINFIDNLYQELENAVWYTSPTKFCRSDIMGETRSMIEQFMPFKVFCCGFFKQEPGFKYPIHKDSQRLAAVNIQLCDELGDYKVYSYTDKLKEKMMVPYQKNKPILLNTKKFHSVHNISNDTRYILTVGCITDSYEVIRDRFKQITMEQTNT